MRHWGRIWALAVATSLAPVAVHAAEVRLQAVGPGEAASGDARIDAMLSGGQLRSVRVRDDEDVVGNRHERMVQYHRGVPVWGSGVTRQRGPSGAVSVFGSLFEGIGDLDVTPGLSAETASAIVERLSGAELGSLRGPTLVVFPAPDGTFPLAWRVRATTPTGLWVYFIDARSGTELLRYNNLHSQAAVGLGTGVLGDQKKMSVAAESGHFVASDEQRPPNIFTFDLKGDIARWLWFENGLIGLGTADLASDSDNRWTDGPSVDAHSYAGWTYDYYFKRHGRRGLDNHDMPLVSIVNPARREDYGRYPNNLYVDTVYLNAFWNEDHMVYGVGLPVPVAGQMWNQLAGSLNVVAHELTHGVTQFTSDLIYQNESGALNESFSDMMAVSVEFFFKPDSNYVIGEEIVTPGGIRSMQNPFAYGDADHYSVRYTGTQDNGGVHVNSGIPNNAFYLAIEGGTNRVSGLRVTGVGPANRAKVEKVFYRAFTQMLTPRATFQDARVATIKSANDLYGSSDPAVVTAVTQAWDAVGVK